MIKVAFLIGNGTSRIGFDLESLRGKGTIVGCNALYRDFAPDVLMAIDQKMVNLIGNSVYASDNYFVVPNNRNKPPRFINSYPLNIKKFNTCGCAIMKYAGYVKIDIAYLIGFDCYGQNVYIATDGYGAKFNENRYRTFVRFYEEAMQEYTSTKFINIIKDTKDGISPLLQRKHRNYGTLDMQLFIDNLPRFPKQEPIYAHAKFTEIQSAKTNDSLAK